MKGRVMRHIVSLFAIVMASVISFAGIAQAQSGGNYLINPGDTLQIEVVEDFGPEPERPRDAGWADQLSLRRCRAGRRSDRRPGGAGLVIRDVERFHLSADGFRVRGEHS